MEITSMLFQNWSELLWLELPSYFISILLSWKLSRGDNKNSHSDITIWHLLFLGRVGKRWNCQGGSSSGSFRRSWCSRRYKGKILLSLFFLMCLIYFSLELLSLNLLSWSWSWPCTWILALCTFFYLVFPCLVIYLGLGVVLCLFGISLLCLDFPVISCL